MINQLASGPAFFGTRGSGLPAEPLRASEQTASDPAGERSAGAAFERQSGSSASAPVRSLIPAAVLAIQESDDSIPTGSRNGAQTAAGDKPGQADEQTGTSGSAGTQTASAVAGQSEAAAEQQAKQAAEKKEDPDGDGLNEAEEKQVEKLKERDREVRAHEQAHARVGGAYASAPSYTFQQGPDGKRYAVGGEVQIDTSTERTPEATVRKMEIVIRAALAPAEPSSQDLKVAQQARAQMAEAQAQARAEKAEEQKSQRGEGSDENSSGDVSSATDPSRSQEGGGSRSAGSPEDKGSKAGKQSETEKAAELYQSIAQATAQNSATAQSLFQAIFA